MLTKFLYVAFVSGFVGIVILGHVLLLTAVLPGWLPNWQPKRYRPKQPEPDAPAAPASLPASPAIQPQPFEAGASPT